MTAIEGRVRRLDRTYGLDRAPESEDDRRLRCFKEAVEKIPSSMLRSFLDVGRAIRAGESLTPEHRAITERFNVLWETGGWPA